MSLIAVVLAAGQWRSLLKEKTTLKALKSQITSYQATILWLVAVSISAWILLVLPELIFVKDIYPNHPRANTMFKLTFQAFLMMGLVVGWLAGQLWRFNQKIKSQAGYFWLWFGRWLVLGFVVAMLLYPYFGYRDYYSGLKTRIGLDGTNWLRTQSPDDYAGITWLNQTAQGRPVIVEAVGESYTTFARVSTFTGLPTILGWRVHEWLWRGGFDIPGQRTEEVRAIYEQPLADASQTYLAQYQVKYIFIGSKEREAYVNLDEAGLKTLGTTVFASGDTKIIQIK
jgi:uncharacterized membrane protein